MQRALKPKTPTLSWADAYVTDEVEQAEKRAQKALLEMQHQDGYWWAELQANVTITAEYIMLLQFLGLAERQNSAGWQIIFCPSNWKTAAGRFMRVMVVI